MSGICSLSQDLLSYLYRHLHVEDAANFSATCKLARELFLDHVNQKHWIKELGCAPCIDPGLEPKDLDQAYREQLLRLRRITNSTAKGIPLVLTHTVTLPEEPHSLQNFHSSPQLDLVYKKSLQTFNPRTGKLTTVLESQKPITSYFLDGLGSRIVGFEDGTIELHTGSDEKKVLGNHSGRVNVQPLDENRFLTTSSQDLDLRIWNLDTKEQIDRLSIPTTSAAQGIRQVIANGNQAIVTYIGLSGIYVWDLTSRNYHILEAPFEEIKDLEPEKISLECNHEQLVVSYGILHYAYVLATTKDPIITVIWNLTTQEPTRLPIKCVQVKTFPGNPNLLAIHEGIRGEEREAQYFERAVYINAKHRMSFYDIIKKEFTSRTGITDSPIYDFFITDNAHLYLMTGGGLLVTPINREGRSTAEGRRIGRWTPQQIALHPTQNVLIANLMDNGNYLKISLSFNVYTLKNKTSNTIEEFSVCNTDKSRDVSLSSISHDGLHYFRLLSNRVFQSYAIAPLPDFKTPVSPQKEPNLPDPLDQDSKYLERAFDESLKLNNFQTARRIASAVNSDSLRYKVLVLMLVTDIKEAENIAEEIIKREIQDKAFKALFDAYTKRGDLRQAGYYASRISDVACRDIGLWPSLGTS